MRRYAALGLTVDVSEMDVAARPGRRAALATGADLPPGGGGVPRPAGLRPLHHLGLHGRLHLAGHREAPAPVQRRGRAEAGLAGDPDRPAAVGRRMMPRYFLDLPEESAPIPWDVHAGPRPERADTRYFGAAFAAMERASARPGHRRVPDLGHGAAARLRPARGGRAARRRGRADSRATPAACGPCSRATGCARNRHAPARLGAGDGGTRAGAARRPLAALAARRRGAGAARPGGSRRRPA